MSQGSIVRAICAAGALLFSATSISADTQSYAFGINLLGIKAGELRYSVRHQGNQYSAAGKVFPTGLAAQFVKFAFDVSVSGRVIKNGYAPTRYSEKSDNGRRQEEKYLTYTNGIARVKSPKLPKPYWADPKDQKGTVDPMTAIFWTLSDKTKDELCRQNIPIFDGARRVQIKLSNPQETNESATCDGVYKRVDGFSQSELKEGTTFPFSITYEKIGDIYRTKRFDVQSVRGRVSVTRQ